MSGMGLTLSAIPASARRPVTPLEISAVTGWLRFALGTVTGLGYSSVPDVLGGSPAVQASDASRMAASTSANGLPIAVGATGDYLSWPVSAANNGAARYGIATWVKTSNAGFQDLYSIYLAGGGANATKVDVFLNAGALSSEVAVGGSCTKAAPLLPANTWAFFTFEYDGSQATDAARLVVTVNGVVQATTNTSIPVTSPTPTGNAFIGGFSVLYAIIGALGPNFYSLGRQLTPAERANLMAFEAPT